MERPKTYWKSILRSNPCKSALQAALFLNWRKKVFYFCLRPLHLLLSRCFSGVEKPRFRRILLSNQGSLGDIFLSTFVIPALKQAHPGCEIGLLASREAAVAAKGVDKIHYFDHWLEPYDPFGRRLRKFFHFHLVGKRRIARELRAEGYDCVLHLYPFFADFLPVYSRAGIPVRVAFDSGGYRDFATHLIPWQCGHYLIDHYQRLLEAIGVVLKEGETLQTPWISCRGAKQEYVVFHMGSKDPKKELALPLWKTLLEKFQGELVYFTGKGERENGRIEEVISHEAQNLCDRMSFEEWVACLAGARLVVSVDSAAVHIAAAMGTPFVAFYQNVPDPDLWRPNQVATTLEEALL